VLDGKTDIAIGNVVDSNIFNVLFILGISALIAPLVVNIQLIVSIQREEKRTLTNG
jgi:cation:H+ antiporter